MAVDLAREYPLFDDPIEGTRHMACPDGEWVEVDFQRIGELAESGALADLPEPEQVLVRYMLGEADENAPLDELALG